MVDVVLDGCMDREELFQTAHLLKQENDLLSSPER